MRPNFYQRKLSPNFGISWKWFWRLTTTALIVFLANFLWNFGHKTFSLYRASQYQKAAEALISENKNDEALWNIQKALFLVPDHIASCRLMARLLDERDDPRALDYYRFIVLQGSILPGEIQLGDAPSDMFAFFEGGGDVLRSGDKFLGDKEQPTLSPNATREDTMNLSLAAVKYGKLIVAWDAANLLSAKWKDSAFPHLIKASINGKMGDFEAQELELRTALSKAENLETLTAFYQFLLTQPPSKPERSAELLFFLEKITSLDPTRKSLELGVNAITEEILNQNDALSLLQIIRRHPTADSIVLLFADKYQLHLQPSSREQILQNLAKRSLTSSPTDRIPAVNWLIDIQEPKLAQTVLPLPDAMQNPKTFDMWVEVAILLKQWTAIDKALSDPANPLLDYQKKSLEAIILGLKGDSTKSRKLWTEVFETNRANPEILLELFVKLTRLGEWKLLYLEMPSLLNNQLWASKSLQKLIPVARRHRDSAQMLEFYRQAVKSPFLANEDVINDRIAYTRLILGEDVPITDLEGRAKKNPENSAFRITHALKLLKSGSKVKALFELKDVEPSVSTDSLLPYQQSVYAAVLAANGHDEEAQALIKSIPPDSLTQQEEAFVSALLALKKAH